MMFRTLTIFPEANTRAVVLGSLMRIMTAAKRCTAWLLEFFLSDSKPAACMNFEPLFCNKTSKTKCRARSNLGVVLCVAGPQSNLLEVKLASEVYSSYNIL